MPLLGGPCRLRGMVSLPDKQFPDDSARQLEAAAARLQEIGYIERYDLAGEIRWTERGQIVANHVGLFMREFGHVREGRLVMSALMLCMLYTERQTDEGDGGL